VAKTLDNLVDEVRLMLKDRRTPYRWAQTDILAAINSSFREAQRLRPDIFVGCCTDEDGGAIPLPDFVEADLNLVPTPTPYPIDEIFFMPSVFYAVGKLQLGDDEFTLDNRAMTLLAGFHQALVGG
jgi:hypothetical protein